MNITLRIFLIILTALIAIATGLLLRRLLVHRLRNTILDKTLVQTLGIIALAVPLIAAVPVSLTIWDTNLLFSLWAGTRPEVHVQNITALAGNILETLLIIVLGVGIARTLAALIIRSLNEERVDSHIRTLIKRILYIVMFIFVIIWIFAIWEVPIGIPLAAIGIPTIIFSIALQDIIKDLAAGFYILIERPFHIGDQITIGNQVNLTTHTGIVEDVQLRATRLHLVSGEELRIPNAIVFGNIVINNSSYAERRAVIIVTVSEEEFDQDETPKQILTTLRGIDAILAKPEPTVILSGFRAKKISLSVRFWIAPRQLPAVSEAMYALRAALPNADLAVHESTGDV